MPKTKSQKAELKESLTEKTKRQRIMIFARAHGLSVGKQEALRRQLKQEDAEYKIAKKTILKRALDEAGLPFPEEGEKGELGVVFGYGDEISPAKVLAKFRKENAETFSFLGAILGTRSLSSAEMMTLAKLPGKQELIGQLVGVLASPICGLMNVLNGNQRKLVVALAQIAKNK